jgi:Leucine-rich repeat (LRR) protein
MKPQQILDLEKTFGIVLTLDTIYSHNKNTYNLNAAGEVVMLNLQQNKITDISCLKDLTSLEDLNLMGNTIVDITPLTNLRRWTTKLGND